MYIPITTVAAAEEATGIGALGLDGKVLLIQLTTFVLAFFVLRKYAFKPILKIMDERRETIENGVALGIVMKQQQAELDAQVAAELQKSRVEADGIIAGAQETAKQSIRDAEDKAKLKAQGILDEADDRIAQDTQAARKQLEKELVGLISDATEAIIDEKVDAKKDAALIDRALKEARS